MNDEMITYQIRVSADLVAKFRAIAKKNDRSPAGEVRAFMREYVARYEEGDDGEDIPF